MVRQINYKISHHEQKQRQKMREKVFEQIKQTEEDQPAVCEKFSCGRKLTLTEQLCGKLCLEHSGERKIDITKVLKFR